MKKIFNIYLKYQEVINYLIVGFLTTLVSIFSYYVFIKLSIYYIISEVLSWIISVIFAYIMNKKIVFNSKNKNIFKELSSFIICRILSLLFDILIMFMLVDFFNLDKMISKLIVQVFIVIINYIFSKFFVFKKAI